MINPIWLRTFCTLVETGHFTQTADKLFMTQSGVSQHVKKLEQQLGCELLIREGKRFSLTSAGKQVFSQGQDILSSLNALSQGVQQDPPFVGAISLASPGSIGLHLYPKLLDFQQLHPDLSFAHTFAPNRSIEQGVAKRSFDLGIVTQLSGLDELVTQKIGSEPLVLVTSHDQQELDWQGLLKLGFIAHPDGHHHSQLLLSANFGEFESSAQFVQRGFSNQISLILEPVSRGLGFTVLPINVVHSFSRRDLLKVHTLATPVSEPLYLCYHRRGLLPRRVKTMIDFITANINPDDHQHEV
ncbi:LysR family transcriptional regulator [Motilimonas eburnea]|uniref:LysR family transcriptional regulator n=1 Tax=Motilimonas eburnea TaxID=1737488 RepID=UPI001E3F60C3|nr:LysR family transcriptional regulator [Motilimonas eburnea]MCE2572339.1 LysR family transcriptional regulator [Motilimonas eburnea]